MVTEQTKQKLYEEFAGDFMQPHTSFEEVWVYESKDGGAAIVPTWVCGKEELQTIPNTEIEKQEGWIARLSADGFMDATDWIGVFETEEEALNELMDVHGSD